MISVFVLLFICSCTQQAKNFPPSDVRLGNDCVRHEYHDEKSQERTFVNFCVKTVYSQLINPDDTIFDVKGVIPWQGDDSLVNMFSIPDDVRLGITVEPSSTDDNDADIDYSGCLRVKKFTNSTTESHTDTVLNYCNVALTFLFCQYSPGGGINGKVFNIGVFDYNNKKSDENLVNVGTFPSERGYHQNVCGVLPTQ